MKIIAMFLTLAVVAVTSSAQPAGNTAPAGAVVIINGKTINLKPGETPKLNPGDKVSVVSGDVKFVLPGGDTVNASGAGAAFNLSSNDNVDDNKLKVVYAGGTVSVSDKSGHTDSLSATNSTVVAGQSYAFLDNRGVWGGYSAVAVQNTQQNTKNQAVSGSTP